MIKLIASDLDGTLLLPDGSLPDGIFPLIERLADAGVLFTVASGRQYAGLKTLFAPVADKVLFIAENGALVAYRGETLYDETIPPAALPAVLAAVRAQAGAYPLLCCVKNAYAEDDYPPFLNECKKYYPNFERLPRLEDAKKRDPVCKIAVFDDRGAAEFSGKFLAEALPSYRVTVSGKVWSDISMPETNKGKALTFAMRHFHFSKAECVAFGDYMNDLEMLLACGKGYVTANGFPLLKEKIGNVVPSNAERGVITEIEKILKENA